MRRLATLVLAAIALPVLAAAQQPQPTPAQRGRGQRMEQDTTRRARPAARRARRHRTRTSGGEVAMQSGLDHSQVEQLQEALRTDGCDPGPADGVIGPRTRQAMACARQKHNLTGRNTNELLRALNLPFTTSDSTGMGGMMRREGRMRDTTGMMPDTTGDMMRDTTGRMMHGNRGMRGMRGMHDTTGGRMHNRTGRPNSARPDTTQ